MKRLNLILATTIISILAILTFAKYFDMSICNVINTSSSHHALAQCNTTTSSNAYIHHIETVSNFSLGIFMSIFIIFQVIASLLKLKNYQADLQSHINKHRQKLRRIILGKSKNPFDCIRALISKGIFGSNLQTA